jgi:hypothetical protein
MLLPRAEARETEGDAMSGLGHGHVTPNADGSKARCGGPGLCNQCSQEFARTHRQPKASHERLYAYVRHIGNCGAVDSHDPADDRCICGLRQLWLKP